MVKYEYVNVKSDGSLLGSFFKEHRTIIDEYAAKGFTFKGFFPVKIAGNGRIYEIDLIFEQTIVE